MKRKGLVLSSGGIDSTVLAYHLAKSGELGGMYFVDYGQKSAKRQFELVKHHASKLGVLRHCWSEKITLPPYMRGSGYIMSGRGAKPMKKAYESVGLKGKAYQEWLRDVWDIIPARNLLFLTYACGYALAAGFEWVHVGFQFDREQWERMHKVRWYGLEGSDITPQFVDNFNTLSVEGGFHKFVAVAAPWLDDQRDKEWIIKRGQHLGVDLSKTYSCEFYPECGACSGCLVKKKLQHLLPK